MNQTVKVFCQEISVPSFDRPRLVTVVKPLGTIVRSPTVADSISFLSQKDPEIVSRPYPGWESHRHANDSYRGTSTPLSAAFVSLLQSVSVVPSKPMSGVNSVALSKS